MRADIKQAWIMALRSGEYKQGIGALRTQNRYCCLGVLCDVVRKEFLPSLEMQSSDGGQTWSFGSNDDKCFAELPNAVVNVAGLNDMPNPMVITADDNNRRRLAYLNDDGMSFSDIADLIEANL
jgi:hypothetical protein